MTNDGTAHRQDLASAAQAQVPARAKIARPYCLECYAPMARFEGTSHTCELCGRLNLEVDQRSYWTRERRFVAIETTLKALILALVLGIYAWMVWPPRMNFGTGQGWAIGMPILFGIVLWESASKVTRRKPYFNAGLFWGGVVAVVVVPFLAVQAVIGALDLTQLAVGLGMLLLCAGLGWGVTRLARRIERWRESYVALHQARLGS